MRSEACIDEASAWFKSLASLAKPMRPALAIFVAALAVLSVAGAGCLGSGNGIREVPPPPDEVETPEPRTQEIAFTMGGGAGTPVAGVVLPTDDERLHPFDVAQGYVTLTVTAEWECTNPVLCDLEVHLRRGNQDLVTAAYGASPLTLSVDEPEEGRYTLIAFADGDGSVALGVEGTFTVRLE